MQNMSVIAPAKLPVMYVRYQYANAASLWLYLEPDIGTIVWVPVRTLLEDKKEYDEQARGDSQSPLAPRRLYGSNR